MIDLKIIRENLEAVQERIASAARVAGRDLSEIRLVVITKGHPSEAIKALFNLGVRDIGESYAEEGQGKQMALPALPGLKWHMVGHVQSRKASEVVRHYDILHSLDSLKLAQRLDRLAGDMGGSLPVLLEFNVSGEVSKHGFAAQDPGRWTQLYNEIDKVLSLPNLHSQGLMTIAPVVESADQARPTFAKLRQLRDALATRFPQHDWSQLSMGMSDDFEAAVHEGATFLRVGTAILGARQH